MSTLDDRCGKWMLSSRIHHEETRSLAFDLIQERQARLEAIAEALTFISPEGHSEELAKRVLTDPVLFAFAYLAWDYKDRFESVTADWEPVDPDAEEGT